MSTALLEKLKSAFSDRQLFLVGGAVRDELLGRAHDDLDLATDCRPEETRARVAAWADSVWSVGEKFGTIGLELAGHKAEITTFRADTYDGADRHPSVTYGDSIEADLARRDLTINAMARNVQTGVLIDPFSGQEDLRERRIRFVGEPQLRIREDPLRLLRAVRFAAQLGFALEEASSQAIWELAGELTRISWERIRDEYDRILVSDHAAEGIRQLIALHLAHYTIPELETLHLEQNPRYHLKDVLEHTLEAVELAPADKLLRWTLLLHDIAKPATFSYDEEGVHFYRHEEAGAEIAGQILIRLRQPAELIAAVEKLIRHHLRIPMFRPEWSDAAVRRLMYDLGDEFDLAVEVAKADVGASHIIPGDNFPQRLAAFLERCRAVGEAAELARMRPLLNGQEVMELLGIAPGPLVGEVHRMLLSEQIEGRITTAEAARALVLEQFGKRHA
jgi:poly(A) polymerase